MMKPIYTKNRKISQVWWCMPVISASWEAEAGVLLEPGAGGGAQVALSQDLAIALQPGTLKGNSISKKKKKIRQIVRVQESSVRFSF